MSRLELEILDKVPRKTTPIVLYDNGDGLVARAAHVLADLGYTRVGELDGGLAGWRAAGYELFQDVNSYSKAFGELVEHYRHTPSLPAPEALKQIDTNPDLVVLDARRYDEFQTMSIPRGMSVPGAELVLRAREIAPDPKTTIIVNCAGRTRSIIGAQSLINAGLPNPVYALRNGSIGWKLAGQVLDHGKDARFPQVSPEHAAEARLMAREVAYRAGVKRLDPAMLSDLAKDETRTLYCFDVRTPEEYAAGHIPGFKSAPGGQLVQETDMNAAVRGARIVLADDIGPRADMSASWLAQMGWEVYVLDGALARLAAADLAALTHRKVYVLNGGTAAWSATGKPLETGLTQAASDPDDVYRRPYEGTDNAASAMQAYLDWEYGRVAQLARDGSHGFFVI